MAVAISTKMAHEIANKIMELKKGSMADIDVKSLAYYDFDRPLQFTRSDMQFLEKLFTDMALELRIILPQVVNAPIQWSLASVSEIMLDEFLRSIPEETPLVYLEYENSNYPLLLEIDSPFYLALLNLLSKNDERVIVNRDDITQKDVTKLSDFVRTIVNKLSTNVYPTTKCDFQLLNPDPPSKELKSLNLNQMCVMVSFEILLEGLKGMINFCYFSDFLKLQFEDNLVMSCINRAENKKKEPRHTESEEVVFALGSCTIEDLIKWDGQKDWDPTVFEMENPHKK